MPKRKKPPEAKKSETPSQSDLKKAAETVLRYRAQPGMRSKRRFINPTS